MTFKENVAKLREFINASSNIVVLTGAGISVPSGIPDFRSSTGIYNTSKGIGRSPEYMLSRTCFDNDTEDFYAFYKEKILHKDAKPNLAHQYLAKLEDSGKLRLVITQNIDGLHEAAGSKKLVNFHGTIYKNHCTCCGKSYPLSYVMESDGIPRCSCGGVIKPDVVLYEESLDKDDVSRSIDAISKADMMIVIGTSLIVYPAAGLVDYYKGDKLVLINKDRTLYNRKANLSIFADIIDVVKELDS